MSKLIDDNCFRCYLLYNLYRAVTQRPEGVLQTQCHKLSHPLAVSSYVMYPLNNSKKREKIKDYLVFVFKLMRSREPLPDCCLLV